VNARTTHPFPDCGWSRWPRCRRVAAARHDGVVRARRGRAEDTIEGPDIGDEGMDLEAQQSRDARGPLGTHGTGRTRLTDRSGRTRRARGTLRTGGTGRTLRTRGTRRALRTRRALWTRRALRPRRALGTRRADGARGTLGAGRTDGDPRVVVLAVVLRARARPHGEREQVGAGTTLAGGSTTSSWRSVAARPGAGCHPG